MQGLASDKDKSSIYVIKSDTYAAKRKGKVRESPKSRCEHELSAFMELHQADWKPRLNDLGLEVPPYSCIKRMMIIARLKPIFLQKLYPEEYKNDITVEQEFSPKKRGRVPRNKDTEWL